MIEAELSKSSGVVMTIDSQGNKVRLASSSKIHPEILGFSFHAISKPKPLKKKNNLSGDCAKEEDHSVSTAP